MPLDLLSYSGEGSHLGKKKKGVSSVGFFSFCIVFITSNKSWEFSRKNIKDRNKYLCVPSTCIDVTYFQALTHTQILLLETSSDPTDMLTRLSNIV